MRIGKSVLMAVLTVALGAYAFDCEAMTTNAQGMDCCKTMPSTHAPFMQSSSVHLSFSPVVFAVMPAFGEPQCLDSSSSCHVAARGHAPPTFYVPDALPLRI